MENASLKKWGAQTYVLNGGLVSHTAQVLSDATGFFPRVLILSQPQTGRSFTVRQRFIFRAQGL